MLLDEVAFPQPCFAARSAAALHRKVKESRIALLALRNATNNQYPLLAAVIASCFVFGIVNTPSICRCEPVQGVYVLERDRQLNRQVQSPCASLVGILHFELIRSLSMMRLLYLWCYFELSHWLRTPKIRHCFRGTVTTKNPFPRLTLDSILFKTASIALRGLLSPCKLFKT
ncbi:hypothetical protein ACMD2_26471 [Ananas comosus]|uniref:Uncharacterized protein n=1 Tax=Ananas comosus TaxID=4615 RepID=A0A199UW03_ANACO|nr:hypothetical protein ACMD2_26471 [Ananas comosus]